MIQLFANAFRHGGPVGGLFVLVLTGLYIAATFLPGLLQSLFEWDLLPATLVLAILMLAFVLRLRPTPRAEANSGPISQWPKLGQNDHRQVRSKLQKPSRRK